MSIRVDLLKPEEFRYQGAVSRQFVVRAVVGSIVCIVLLLLGSSLLRARMVKHELETSTDAWAAIEPRYNRIRDMQAALGINRGLAEELNAWKASRVEWTPLLVELANLVPADLQLTKLSTGSEMYMIDEEGERSVDGETPVRIFSMRIDGRASGALADETVVRFVDAIDAAPSFNEVLESVRLQGLQRTRSSEAGQRVFGIEALFERREMK